MKTFLYILIVVVLCNDNTTTKGSVETKSPKQSKTDSSDTPKRETTVVVDKSGETKSSPEKTGGSSNNSKPEKLSKDKTAIEKKNKTAIQPEDSGSQPTNSGVKGTKKTNNRTLVNDQKCKTFKTVGYWGQNSVSNEASDKGGWEKDLIYYCKQQYFDVIIIGFNIGTSPLVINLANHCEKPFTGSSLIDCTIYEKQIIQCQKMGILILLSVGGAAGSYSFASDAAGKEYAGILWKTFLGGKTKFRPFGKAVLDGIDFDIEGGSKIGWSALGKELRKKFETDKTKQYYLSAAPQCVFPDAFLGPSGEGTLLNDVHINFINVQFYNNACGILHADSDAFNFKQWADWANTKNSLIILGVPGSIKSSNGDFQAAPKIVNLISRILSSHRKQFGGVMMWDVDMSASYTSIEPAVIDEELLKKAMEQQIEALKLALKNDNITADQPSNPNEKNGEQKVAFNWIDPSEVTCLRLDFKNILKIDNLWCYEQLTKLQLDNNIIEKIENINFLVNLEWLDLSFNNITKIEGLDELTKLTDLSLFSNRITKIAGLDNLVNLVALSIGNNAITDISSLGYLKKLKKLKILTSSGNPIAKDPDYKHFVCAYLKTIKYLDYRMIETEEVKAAEERYMNELIANEHMEKEQSSRLEAELKKKQQEEGMTKRLYLDNIDKLFDLLITEDKDLAKILPLADVQLRELQENYRAKLEVVILELRIYISKQADIRAEELVLFKKCIDETKREVDSECIRKIQVFTQFKKKALRCIHNGEEIEKMSLDVKNGIKDLSNYLMSREMTLVEQFEDIIKELEQNYNTFVSQAIEVARQNFARFRELENEYHEKATEIVINAFDRYAKTDLDELDDVIKDLLVDKDVVVNLVNASHDYHLGKFDQQEEILLNGLNKELERTFQTTQQNELQRNRGRVNEIAGFVDRCLKELDQAEESLE